MNYEKSLNLEFQNLVTANVVQNDLNLRKCPETAVTIFKC